MAEALATTHFEVVRSGRFAYVVCRVDLPVYKMPAGEVFERVAPAKAAAAMAKAEAQVAEALANRAEERAYRVKCAREYLAKRAIREASYPTQLKLF
ncbi:MAG: hypothetical protein HXX10_07545 [Rhodoplanes sp.]|uniref:hypothetical protein n=1 Tax=Rhodoplanes sp. TaxID=1968906 RepID=UPI001806969E|nr:hypothetical protein [Rhodoplanes sp.]NVO13874.1 hypothetical protein [Rhodoplanes sp.]